MPEFTVLQRNAKQFIYLLASEEKQAHCYCFFTAVIPQLLNDSPREAAETIALMARCLDENKDLGLLRYLKTLRQFSSLDADALEHFKMKVLTGLYLMLWSGYTSTVSAYLNQRLIALFQRELEVQSPEEMDNELFNASCTALSQYCSFIYQSRDEPLYAQLNTRLGSTVQGTILSLKNSHFQNDSPLYGYYLDIKCSLGLN